DPPQRAPAPARIDVPAQMKAFKPSAGLAAAAPFEATPANIDAMTQRFTVGGLQVAVLPKPTRGDVVEAVLTLRFGDEKSLAGWGSVPGMVADMLDKGTRQRSRQQIQDRLDELLTDLSIGAGIGKVT